jgi:hypothetical protein
MPQTDAVPVAIWRASGGASSMAGLQARVCGMNVPPERTLALPAAVGSFGAVVTKPVSSTPTKGVKLMLAKP